MERDRNVMSYHLFMTLVIAPFIIYNVWKGYKNSYIETLKREAKTNVGNKRVPIDQENEKLDEMVFLAENDVFEDFV